MRATWLQEVPTDCVQFNNRSYINGVCKVGIPSQGHTSIVKNQSFINFYSGQPPGNMLPLSLLHYTSGIDILFHMTYNSQQKGYH